MDFQREGLALLYRQVEIHGGCGRWAREFGLSHSELHRPLKGWSEERVRAELAEFLPDGDGWPTAADFRRAHRLMLYVALKQFGGRERWAAEFGRTLSFRQRDTTAMWTDARIEEALRSLAGDSIDLSHQQADGGGRLPRSLQRRRAAGVAGGVGGEAGPLPAAPGARPASLDRRRDQEAAAAAGAEIAASTPRGPTSSARARTASTR